MNLFQKLKKANDDYHEAANDILCDEDFIEDTTIRAEVKVLFGTQIAQVFHHMAMAEDIVKQYYPEK